MTHGGMLDGGAHPGPVTPRPARPHTPRRHAARAELQNWSLVRGRSRAPVGPTELRRILQHIPSVTWALGAPSAGSSVERHSLSSLSFASPAAAASVSFLSGLCTPQGAPFPVPLLLRAANSALLCLPCSLWVPLWRFLHPDRRLAPFCEQVRPSAFKSPLVSRTQLGLMSMISSLCPSPLFPMHLPCF